MTKGSKKVLENDGKTMDDTNLFARSIISHSVDKPSENRLSRSENSVYYTDLLHNLKRSDGSTVCDNGY